ncbi:MAG: (2Fe-2S)-binding protein [Phycisphaerae bacterium]
MQPDDDVCYCHHVSLRKLVNFALRTRPAHAEQMSDCLGAGTGCGWCIPFLKRIAEAASQGQAAEIDISSDEYGSARGEYRKSGRRNEFDA